MKKIILVIVGILLISLYSCSKEKEGCTNSSADNYDAEAEVDDGSCETIGRISFFTTDCSSVDGSNENITVYLNGDLYGTINNCFPVLGCSSLCSCSQSVQDYTGGYSSYSASKWIDYGNYSYKAYNIDSSNTWTGSYNLTRRDNNCVNLE